MASKTELQDILLKEYSINKNISKSLKTEECEKLLHILKSDPGTAKLIQSFVRKNAELGKNNSRLGTQRWWAEKKFESLQVENSQLKANIRELKRSNLNSQERQELEDQIQQLEVRIDELTTSTLDSEEGQKLKDEIQQLNDRNRELNNVNQQLMKDNKDLKNTVDQIRLRLAQKINELLRYEDSEIRKGLIELFRWTGG